MVTLSSTDRSRLERMVLEAREVAERGVRKRFDALDLAGETAPAGLSADDRALRNALRERARQLGRGRVNPDLDNVPAIKAGEPFLVEELAYDTWHRMLFARFLAENDLLIHPEYGVALSTGDIFDLAAEQHADSWELAADFAAHRLPGLFHLTTPLRLASEDRQDLSRTLGGLDSALFHASDALGWVYQYWQSKRKDEVNAAGEKITGATLPPVTQLFTEDYMVDFLLQNSLGAWYASRHPETRLTSEWPYLRYRDDGTPAAGTFPTWPETVAGMTVMDPCCGSGHFLVAALHMLTAMRQEEEGLAAGEAVDAVLRDNLFGLELDARCTQIATFAVALEAWKLGGHPETHLPQIACSGIPVAGQKADWLKLAKGDTNLKLTLEALYDLFSQAGELGSLIDPKQAALMGGSGTAGQRGFMLQHEWGTVERELHRALEREQASDPAAQIFDGSDHDLVGTIRAAQLLGRTYTLVATNVPFLSRGNHGPVLRKHADTYFAEAKNDLATMFFVRILDMLEPGGGLAGVSPYNWYFLGAYKKLRQTFLETVSFEVVSNLGFKSFRTPMWDFNIGLTILQNEAPVLEQVFAGIDASEASSADAKAEVLRCDDFTLVGQAAQVQNPDQRIVLEEIVGGPLLEDFAEGFAGIMTGDGERFISLFWEPLGRGSEWEFLQTTVGETTYVGGMHKVILWEGGSGQLRSFARQVRERLHDTDRRGNQAWGKRGVCVSQMRNTPAVLYEGDKTDNNVAIILPKNPDHLPAIWAFCSSPEFNTAIRKIDSKLNVTNATLVKVPFDLEHWQKVAEEKYPDGLPEPYSSDPTQWLFDGTIPGSDHPLQVAMARMLGYRWPDQVEDGLDRFVDRDGIACLPSVYQEAPADDRLREVLRTAYGDSWSEDVLAGLLRQAGAASLEDWLRDSKGFFAQHVRLFHNRPFLWQVTDGRKDGFSAVVNYHRLTPSTLSKLIYTYLGDWIARQQRAVDNGEAGAQGRLDAATSLRQKLVAIASGEPPYDIYVRWKSLAEQPIGWEPDLNDGVRLNIRPWIEAGVLQAKVNAKWGKDRGKDPAVRDEPLATGADADLAKRIALHVSVDRHNDLHFTNAEKRKARELAEG